MIAPLRRRHRWTTASLAVALPVLYVAALTARPDESVVETLPEALAPAAAGAVDVDLGILIEDPPVAVRTRGDRSRRRRASGTPERWWLELEPREPIVRPEVLVYWSRSSATAGRLPEDAVLMGSLAGDRARAFELPEDALGLAGTLVLYSLGHQQTIASTRLPAIGWAPAQETAASPEASP